MSKKQFLFAIALLMGLVANAQWVKPVPTLSPSSALVVAEEFNSEATSYYLWNEETKSFLGEGNKWNSQTSLSEGRGVRIFFQKYKVDGEVKAGHYYLNTYLDNDSPNGNRPRWDWFWINIGSNEEYGWSYTDYKEPGCNRGYPNDPLWDFEVDGNNVRVKTADLMPNFNATSIGHACYLGKPASAEAGSTVIMPTCTTSDNVNWRVVTKADYDTFRPKYLAYAAAIELKDAIDKSKETYPGIDLSALEKVYNNTNSTAEELKAALNSIPELEKQFAATHITATVDKPYDATVFITNPNFDGTADGWDGGRLAWNNTISEFWSDKTDTYDYSQTMTNLPNGVYKIEVYSFHRIGNPDWEHYRTGVLADDAQYRRTSQIYANNYWMLNHDMTDAGHDTNIHPDQYYKINDIYYPDGVYYADKAFNEYHDYNNELFAAVTDGTLKIGIRCLEREQFSWTPSDTWRLTYYGNSADAREMMKANLKANLKDYSEAFILATLKEQYEQALTDLDAATSYEAIEAAYAQAMSLFYDMEKSRNAYNHYIALIEEIIPQTEDLDCEENDLLLDYLDEDYETILNTTPLSIEELAQEEEKVKEMLEAAIKNTVEVGKDYTSLIPNHDMTIADFKSAGWDVEYSGNGSIAGNKDHLDRLPTQYHIGEIWRFKNFDMSYTLTGMPRGIYELEIPAVYRNRARDFSNPAPCEIYVNDLSKNIMTALEGAISEDEAISTDANPGEGYSSPEEWGDANCFNKYTVQDNNEGWPNDWRLEVEGANYYIPGSCDGAAVAFYAGRYINKVYGVVGDDGILKLGLRSKNTTGADEEWIAIGRIKMTYMGTTEEALNGVKDEVDAQAEIYRNRTELFYKGYLNELDEAVNGLLTCSSAADVIAASAAVQNVYEKIDKSVELYKQIDKLVSTEGTGLYNAASRLFDEGKLSEEEAKAYMSEAEGYISAMFDGTIDNEEAERIIEAIKTNKAVDVIYIRGGLLGADGDDWSSYEYPMFRNAEGKYVGRASFREERHGNVNIYAGHRVLVVFHYLDMDICSEDNATRFLNENPAPRKMRFNDNSSWFTTWGGEWEFTIDMNDSTLVAKPVGKMLYKNQIYAVGNLNGNHWALNETTAKHWELVHQGKGIYQGSIAFNDDVERGEVTLFTSDMWFTGNWGESRIGSVEDQLKLEDGQEVACNRFQGDRKWILDPTHKYLCTYDMTRGVVRFDVNDLEGDDTEASPLLIDNLEDLMMMRAYMRQGETHYFALTSDIDMWGKGWSTLNGAGQQNDKEYQRWVCLDGRGHCIKNFNGATGLQSIDDNSFFGVLGGTVKNVGFVNVNLVEDADYMMAYSVINARSMAAVAGKLGSPAYDNTVVENVFVTGNINGGLSTGSIAGTVEGNATVKNVFAQADVTSENEVTAGLIGDVFADLTLQNAYFVGDVTTEKPILGAVEDGKKAEVTNVVNWTRYTSDAPYNFDGSNHAALQQTVVAFDPTVWGCSMQEGDYPVLKAFGDELPSAIQSINGTTDASAAIYDLTGRRVERATRGIYIIGGRKVVIK